MTVNFLVYKSIKRSWRTRGIISIISTGVKTVICQYFSSDTSRIGVNVLSLTSSFSNSLKEFKESICKTLSTLLYVHATEVSCSRKEISRDGGYSTVLICF